MDNNHLENNDWKKEAPLLAGLPVHNPFSIPEGYFEGLPVKVSNQAYLETLKTKTNGTGFVVPEGYFNDLNKNINFEILSTRIKNAVTEVNNYTLPANYFEQLQSDILRKTVKEPKKTTKVVRLWRSSLLKYASAACFIILSATGFYFYQQQYNNKTAYTDLATEQMLYDIDEQIIIDHIQANDLQQAQPSGKDAALENYILNNYSQSDIARDL